MTISWPAHAEVPPRVMARIEPMPSDNAAKALALFLSAMDAVDHDIQAHTERDDID